MATAAPDSGARPQPAWHAATAVLLILVIFGLSFVGIRDRVPHDQTQDEFQTVVNGDLAIKMWLFARWAERRGAKAGGDTEKLLPRAQQLYRTAAGLPTASPAAIRRALVLADRTDISTARIYSLVLASPEMLEGRSPQEIEELSSEAGMWTAIYGGVVTPADAISFDKRIRSLGMGPITCVALFDLYTAAGSPRLADAAMEEGENRAVISFWPLVLIGLMILLALPLGLVSLALVYARRQQWFGAKDDEGVPHSDTLYLAFNAYLLLMLVVSALAIVVTSDRLSVLPPGSRTDAAALTMLATTVVVDLLALIVLVALLRGAGKRIRAIGVSAAHVWKDVLAGVLGYCAMFPVLLGSAYAWAAFQRVVMKGVQTPAHPLFDVLGSTSPLALGCAVMMAVVLAPVFEEIFFRGVFYRAIRQRRGIGLAALASGTAFAVIHPFPASFLPVLVMGIGFALMTESRRSLVPSMTAHAIHNGLSFLLFYLIST